MVRKLVNGVGVNDADYTTEIKKLIGVSEEGKKLYHRWVCPYYRKWSHMLYRCYDETFKIKRPSYAGCSVAPEWHYFMTFRSWMAEQDWQDKELDKDLLVPGNKVYGPDTCLFITAKVNTFLLEGLASKGPWPTGVDFEKKLGKYRARCRGVVDTDKRHVGYFNTPEEAEAAYKSHKYQQAIILADQQEDPRVAQALLDRYKI